MACRAPGPARRYYIEYPRDVLFGGTRTVYVADTPEVVVWAEDQVAQSGVDNQSFERVTRNEALRIGKVRKHNAGELYGRYHWAGYQTLVAELLEASARQLEADLRNGGITDQRSRDHE